MCGCGCGCGWVLLLFWCYSFQTKLRVSLLWMFQFKNRVEFTHKTSKIKFYCTFLHAGTRTGSCSFPIVMRWFYRVRGQSSRNHITFSLPPLLRYSWRHGSWVMRIYRDVRETTSDVWQKRRTDGDSRYQYPCLGWYQVVGVACYWYCLIHHNIVNECKGIPNPNAQHPARIQWPWTSYGSLSATQQSGMRVVEDPSKGRWRV